MDRVVKRVLDGVRAARSVWDSGVLRPVRPDRAARMLFPYVRFGATPATAGALAVGAPKTGIPAAATCMG